MANASGFASRIASIMRWTLTALSGPESGRDRPQRFRRPDRSVADPARSRRRDGCGGGRSAGPGRLLHLLRRGAVPKRTGGAAAGRNEAQLVAPHRTTAGPVDIDEECQRRLDDRFVCPYLNETDPIALIDDDELQEIEMFQPRHSGELELSRRTEGHLQSFKIAAPDAMQRNPRIQRLIQCGSGFGRAQLQRGRESRGRVSAGIPRTPRVHASWSFLAPPPHHLPCRRTLAVQPACLTAFAHISTTIRVPGRTTPYYPQFNLFSGARDDPSPASRRSARC